MDKQTEPLVNRLIEVLHGLLSAHEKLSTLLQQKRLFLRAAKYERVTEVCEQENHVIQQISELEKHRLQVAADLTLKVDPQAGEPLRITTLAERLQEPDRGRLLVLRQQLMQRMDEVRTQTHVARRATESLVVHMQGLMQSIGAVCSGMSVYGRDGAPPRAALALSTFNTTA